MEALDYELDNHFKAQEKREKEIEIEDYQNSKILRELEVFDELELRIFFDPKISKEPLRYSIKDGVIIILDEVNTHVEDNLYQIFEDFADFEDFMFEYFEKGHRDFETIYELLIKQEVVSTLIRVKPAKYVFI